MCVFQNPPGLSPQATSIVHMCVSFSYKYLALFTDSGHVWMGSTNLRVCNKYNAQLALNIQHGPSLSDPPISVFEPMAVFVFSLLLKLGSECRVSHTTAPLECKRVKGSCLRVRQWKRGVARARNPDHQ